MKLPPPLRLELRLQTITAFLTPVICGSVVAWHLRFRSWLGPAAIAGAVLALIYYLGSQLLGRSLSGFRGPSVSMLLVGSALFALVCGALSVIGGGLARWWSTRRSAAPSPVGSPAPATGSQILALSSPEAAVRFATEWIDAWNSHDLPRILSHYRDDCEMSSPLIIQRGFAPDGVLRGKAVIAEYWKIGLAAQPPLRFELIEVFRGAGMICLLYRNVSRNRRVIEWFRFDEAGRVSHAAGIYGEPE